MGELHPGAIGSTQENGGVLVLAYTHPQYKAQFYLVVGRNFSLQLLIWEHLRTKNSRNIYDYMKHMYTALRDLFFLLKKNLFKIIL